MKEDEPENQGTSSMEKLGYHVDTEVKVRLDSGSGKCEYDERVILSAAIEEVTKEVEYVDEDVFLVDTENLDEDMLDKWSDRYS